MFFVLFSVLTYCSLIYVFWFLSDCFFIQSYFPTVYSTSEVVLNLLDGNLDTCISTSAYMNAQLATYHYSMCHYQIAFHFTLLAIEQLELCFNHGTPPSPHVTVEVLRIMCKVCIIKRKYSLGLRIIQHALVYTRYV